jgi:hypothetical protein
VTEWPNLYHYTSRTAIAQIVRDGEIRPAPMRLYRDLLLADEGVMSDPIVWLTINPIIETTIVARLAAAARESRQALSLAGELYRIVLPATYSALSLGEYVDSRGMDPSLWDNVVLTGKMAGSDYTCWRLVESPIPAADWLRIERFAGATPTGVDWQLASPPVVNVD